jgi:CheY-like chemotaxis protein
VLIVSDDEVEREGLGVILGRRGYVTAHAEHGQAALDHLKSHPLPDVILTRMMIHFGWWAFMRMPRNDPSLAAILVIVTTGLEVASEEWARSLGARALIWPPFTIEELVNAIEAC